MTNLERILAELQNYKRDKKELITQYVSERLDKSIQAYYKDLLDSYNYLKYKDEVRVAKKFNGDKEYEK